MRLLEVSVLCPVCRSPSCAVWSCSPVWRQGQVLCLDQLQKAQQTAHRQSPSPQAEPKPCRAELGTHTLTSLSEPGWKNRYLFFNLFIIIYFFSVFFPLFPNASPIDRHLARQLQTVRAGIGCTDSQSDAGFFFTSTRSFFPACLSHGGDGSGSLSEDQYQACLTNWCRFCAVHGWHGASQKWSLCSDTYLSLYLIMKERERERGREREREGDKSIILKFYIWILKNLLSWLCDVVIHVSAGERRTTGRRRGALLGGVSGTGRER